LKPRALIRDHMSLNADRADKLIEFMSRIGYRFERIELLDQALTHSSVKEDQAFEGVDNERLEFFGDAVLGFIVTKHLMRSFRNLGEGALTEKRKDVVRNDRLETIGQRMDIIGHMSRGRSIANNAQPPKGMASGALEALIAAIFIDGGECEAGAFIRRFVLE